MISSSGTIFGFFLDFPSVPPLDRLEDDGGSKAIGEEDAEDACAFSSGSRGLGIETERGRETGQS